MYRIMKSGRKGHFLLKKVIILIDKEIVNCVKIYLEI